MTPLRSPQILNKNNCSFKKKTTSTICLRTRWTCSQGCFSTIQANHIHLRFSTGGYAGRCHVRETSKMPRESRAKKPCWRMPELSWKGQLSNGIDDIFGYFSVVCWRWVKMTWSGSNICEYPFMSSYHILTYHIETIYTVVDNLHRAFHNSVLTQWYILQHLVTQTQNSPPHQSKKKHVFQPAWSPSSFQVKLAACKTPTVSNRHQLWTDPEMEALNLEAIRCYLGSRSVRRCPVSLQLDFRWIPLDSLGGLLKKPTKNGRKMAENI